MTSGIDKKEYDSEENIESKRWVRWTMYTAIFLAYLCAGVFLSVVFRFVAGVF